jgi:cobalamin biosynthesis protein CobW
VGARVESHFDRPWTASEPRAGALVVIGLSGLDEAAIRHTLGGGTTSAAA